MSLTLPITEPFFQGVLSVERDGDIVRPWRLPHTYRYLFPSPEDSLMERAACPSGVRLRFETDATALTLQFERLPEPGENQPNGHPFDVVIDNEIVQRVFCVKNAREAVFDTIGKGIRTIEIWLPPSCPVGLHSMQAEKATILRPLPDRRPLWVTWGSSLTHCVRAGSAARVWPATVARRHNLNLINMGFGGNCHLEPMVAMTIRDLPAQYISLKLGINALGNGVSARTYPALVLAAVKIIREKHPHTPLALISPMASPPRESTPSATGYTLQGMRTDMQAVYHALVSAGDNRLYYVDGLDLLGEEDIRRYATDDLLHPDADGIDLQAERFSRLVMPLLLGRTS